MSSFYLKVRFKLRNKDVDKEKIYGSLREVVNYLWKLDYPPCKIYIEKLDNPKRIRITEERVDEFNKKNK